MATTTQNQQKKMEFKPVEFDVNEIAPDAPAGEWQMSIPRGKCKVQGTKEANLPMIIVPIRLERTEEDGAEFQKALGAELSVFLVFGGKTTRGERMAKLRIRQLCEALDVDLDEVPKKISDRDDLEPFIKLIEGKKFTGWTVVQLRKDTGEETTEVRFQDPNRTLRRADADNDDDGDDEAPESRPQRRPTTSGKSNGRRR